ncbi:MAG: WbqC family protein [Rubrivivax sp.]|nr:WbqC family protein [Rubrivivax sp.]
MNTATGRRVAVLQSNYMPWKGYFDIIHDVDLFVFYDDNQYTARDWRNRNRIKTAQGAQWITVPAGEDRGRLIHDVPINNKAWQAKHFESLRQNYGRCPHFARYRGWLEHVYLEQTWTNLSAMNQATVQHIATEFLGITTRFEDSRAHAAQGQKLDKLVDLVVKTGACSYLSGPAARDYIEPQRFADIGVVLQWKDYAGYPEYAQRFAPFEHGVSVLDLLFNTGPDAAWYIWGWRQGPLAA